MGIIEEGAVSGFLPDAVAFAVHYPGYPSSASRAIETLGGINNISKTRRSSPSPLELRFRPEDPYSHPAFGVLRPCTGLLLRISKNRASSCPSERGRSIPSETQLHGDNAKDEEKLREESSSQLSADIVARVTEAYQFEGMVDYQHVPAVHAAEARRKRHWVDVDSNAADFDIADMDQENFMMLVPPFFTLKDIPDNLVLKASGVLHGRQKLEGILEHRWEMAIEPCLGIDFNIQEIPKKFNWEEFIPQDSPQWQWQMAVSKLFHERPIWPRRSIKERLVNDGQNFSDEQFKRALFRVAYYYSRGPFGVFWIRKGYDPRKDPVSRMYQRVDFRIPSQLRRSDGADGLKHSWKDICEFRIFPSKSFSFLQLCELADDYIQQAIRQPSKRRICTMQTGWFSKTMFQSLMLRVKVRFLSIFPGNGVDDMLRSSLRSFERWRRIQNFEEVSSLNEEEHLQESGDILDRTMPLKKASHDVEIIGNVEVDKKSEGSEDQEGDEDGELGLDDGDDNFYLPDSYLNGEGSNSYLHDLFGSFPDVEDRSARIDEIEEYEIYEPESEDGYYCSDDDYGDL